MVTVKTRFRKILKYLLQSGVILFITLLLFELSFRVYIVDFYKGSFQYLNEDLRRSDEAGELLVIGDSFSAFKDGYTKFLSDSLDDYNVTNVSVPGTSIREQYLIGRRYIKRKDPDILLLQFYVGNDLFGWDHPLNWKEVSFLRNVYWKLSESIWSLSFINHKLATLHFAQSDLEKIEMSQSQPFSTELYTQRDKTYLEAEPMIIENSALLKGGRESDLIQYMERMSQLFSMAGNNCQIYILLVPHAAQLNRANVEKFGLLGAKFSSQFSAENVNYTLHDKMVQFFSENSNVKVINALPQLRTIESYGQPVYYANDSHLNVLGQKVLGGIVLRALRNNQVQE